MTIRRTAELGDKVPSRTPISVQLLQEVVHTSTSSPAQPSVTWTEPERAEGGKDVLVAEHGSGEPRLQEKGRQLRDLGVEAFPRTYQLSRLFLFRERGRCVRRGERTHGATLFETAESLLGIELENHEG